MNFWSNQNKKRGNFEMSCFWVLSPCAFLEQILSLIPSDSFFVVDFDQNIEKVMIESTARANQARKRGKLGFGFSFLVHSWSKFYLSFHLTATAIGNTNQS